MTIFFVTSLGSLNNPDLVCCPECCSIIGLGGSRPPTRPFR